MLSILFKIYQLLLLCFFFIVTFLPLSLRLLPSAALSTFRFLYYYCSVCTRFFNSFSRGSALLTTVYLSYFSGFSPLLMQFAVLFTGLVLQSALPNANFLKSLWMLLFIDSIAKCFAPSFSLYAHVQALWADSVNGIRKRFQYFGKNMPAAMKINLFSDPVVLDKMNESIIEKYNKGTVQVSPSSGLSVSV